MNFASGVIRFKFNIDRAAGTGRAAPRLAELRGQLEECWSSPGASIKEASKGGELRTERHIVLYGDPISIR
jgi:hypothetical protein